MSHSSQTAIGNGVSSETTEVELLRRRIRELEKLLEEQKKMHWTGSAQDETRDSRRNGFQKAFDEFSVYFDDILWLLKEDFTVIYVSPADYRVRGYEMSEIVGRSLWDFMTPRSAAKVQQKMERQRASLHNGAAQGSWIFECELLHKNGQLVWLETSISPVYDPHHSLREYRCISRDITHRRQKDLLLNQNAERVQALLKVYQMAESPLKEISDFALEAGVRITQSRIGYLAFLSPDESVLHMYSWSKSAMAECAVPNKTYDYIVEKTGLWGEAVRQRRPVITNNYSEANALKKGIPQGHVLLERHMNVPIFSGSRITMVVGVGNKPEPYNDNDAQQLTLLSTGIWQLIERKQVSDSLKASEDRFRTLFHHMAEGVALHEVIYDEAGKPVNYRLLDANPAYARHTGLSVEAIKGRLAHEVYGTAAPPYLEEFCEVARTGHPYFSEKHFAPLKKYFSISVVSPRKGTFVTVFEDITKRKKSEEELVRKNEELERFTYTVSHDLKSPLITIKGFAGSVLNDVDKGRLDRLPGDLKRITDAADKMSELLNDLLELSRIGRFITPPVDVPLDEVIKEVLELMDGPLKKSQATVRVVGRLPVWQGDRRRFFQVFQNLLENALKFTRSDPDSHIEIGVKPDDESEVYIKDNGIGFAPQFSETIFGLFNKLNSRTEGSGIGLALVRQIIELHGGKIRADRMAPAPEPGFS